MQAKDIPDTPVLQFLQSLGGRCGNWVELNSNAGHDADVLKRSVFHAMPGCTPPKMAFAKMRSLIKRGLASGCPCGCRGDFEITDKGRKLLAAN